MHKFHAGPFPPSINPSRFEVTLGSFSCWLCGSDAFSECDIAAHQDYANTSFPCASCGAVAGDICHPSCDSANTLTNVLTAIQAI